MTKIPASNSARLSAFTRGGGQAEKFLLAQRRRPGDRPAAFLPILRLRLADQPGHEFVGMRRQAEIGLGLLECRQQAHGFAVPRGRPVNRSASSSLVRMSSVIRRRPAARIGAGQGEVGMFGHDFSVGCCDNPPKGPETGTNQPVSGNTVST